MVGLLIRHGHTEAVGRWLAGRRDGVPLTAEGERQAKELANALRWVPITAVYSSPLARAVSTAAPLAGDHGLHVEIRDALTDLDFGEWTGRTLDELASSPEWRRFNEDRSHACPPGGEPLADLQTRVAGELSQIATRHAGETVAIVTHAEPIRCAIAAFEGATLNDVMAIEISPAHVSAVGIGPNFRRVLSINIRGDLAAV